MTEEVEKLDVEDSTPESDKAECDIPVQAKERKVSTESTETVPPVKESKPSEKDSDAEKPVEK